MSLQVLEAAAILLRRPANTSQTLQLSAPRRDTWSIHPEAAPPRRWERGQSLLPGQLRAGDYGSVESGAHRLIRKSNCAPFWAVMEGGVACCGVSTPKSQLVMAAFMVCPPHAPCPAQGPAWRLPCPESGPGPSPGAQHEWVLARNKLGMNPDTPVLTPQSFIRTNDLYSSVSEDWWEIDELLNFPSSLPWSQEVFPTKYQHVTIRMEHCQPGSLL